MDNKFSNLARRISILDRLMHKYYNRELSAYEIGWGQQFYVWYLSDHPGAPAQEVADHMHVDKATLAKNVKKLVGLGYIRVETDDNDKRVKHLYLTDKATPVILQIQKIHNNFYQILNRGIPQQEVQLTEQSMEQMILNIYHEVEGLGDEYLGEL
ncbi:MAG: MarR family transcriptional regulator [Lachnospiraceae bacterium]|nr:MarR family transcriptional regulator [Robinsoniella sp.]MDY3767962.1 MarR family transcriptional regulator [Lachnospiraceae bacterium]